METMSDGNEDGGIWRKMDLKMDLKMARRDHQGTRAGWAAPA